MLAAGRNNPFGRPAFGVVQPGTPVPEQEFKRSSTNVLGAMSTMQDISALRRLLFEHHLSGLHQVRSPLRLCGRNDSHLRKKGRVKEYCVNLRQSPIPDYPSIELNINLSLITNHEQIPVCVGEILDFCS